MEFDRFRLADLPLSQLDEPTTKTLIGEMGEEQVAALSTRKVDDLDESEAETLALVLGRRVQNGIYRHILVTVISELWVDYLTKVDSLRVSIGLEAFAQRDPLVQYKSKAAEMFRELLSEIRIGVISRMFLFQPRRATTQAAPDHRPAAQPSESTAQAAADQKKKRKRH
jgi:preprotein translocase subunit SecA